MPVCPSRDKSCSATHQSQDTTSDMLQSSVLQGRALSSYELKGLTMRIKTSHTYQELLEAIVSCGPQLNAVHLTASLSSLARVSRVAYDGSLPCKAPPSKALPPPLSQTCLPQNDVKPILPSPVSEFITSKVREKKQKGTSPPSPMLSALSHSHPLPEASASLSPLSSPTVTNSSSSQNSTSHCQSSTSQMQSFRHSKASVRDSHFSAQAQVLGLIFKGILCLVESGDLDLRDIPPLLHALATTCAQLPQSLLSQRAAAGFQQTGNCDGVLERPQMRLQNTHHSLNSAVRCLASECSCEKEPVGSPHTSRGENPMESGYRWPGQHESASPLTSSPTLHHTTLSTLQPNQCSHLAEAWGSQQAAPPVTLYQVLQGMLRLSQGRLRFLSNKDLVNSLWSLSKFGSGQTRNLPEFRMRSILSDSAGLGPEKGGHNRLAQKEVSVGIKAEVLISWLQELLEECGEQIYELNPQDISLLLISITRLQITLSPDWILKVLTRAAHRSFEGFSNQHLASLFYTLGKLKYIPSKGWLEGYWEAVGTTVHQWQVSHLASLGSGMHALSRVQSRSQEVRGKRQRDKLRPSTLEGHNPRTSGHYEPVLLDWSHPVAAHLSQRCLACLPVCRPQELCMILKGLCTIRHPLALTPAGQVHCSSSSYQEQQHDNSCEASDLEQKEPGYQKGLQGVNDTIVSQREVKDAGNLGVDSGMDLMEAMTEEWLLDSYPGFDNGVSHTRSESLTQGASVKGPALSQPLLPLVMNGLVSNSSMVTGAHEAYEYSTHPNNPIIQNKREWSPMEDSVEDSVSSPCHHPGGDAAPSFHLLAGSGNSISSTLVGGPAWVHTLLLASTPLLELCRPRDLAEIADSAATLCENAIASQSTSYHDKYKDVHLQNDAAGICSDNYGSSSSSSRAGSTPCYDGLLPVLWVQRLLDQIHRCGALGKGAPAGDREQLRRSLLRLGLINKV
ncbi:hypothetical protein CEUSTIGMA_g8025.t1 [Chlamydomonas eustigma]|uniref:Uncharacterized protein n=1 Tax=Chlamydomonas eustigma TaxID=1157962 RepID=A0A250XBY4_9CHLO|nr:hypothetical protein CEUSTIGMA_g8025.t1 [Chlamydomonas eustigma]|eukprot:GAX80588.1 hypothetical protein CEUSTIGMA_g8025.t1 [Chlamydomonas eustigma]